MISRSRLIGVAALSVGLSVSGSALAGTDTLAGAKYGGVDRFGVNTISGQVQIEQTPLSIGGSNGISHSIRSLTSDFVNWAGRGGGSPTVEGFGDSHRGGFFSVVLEHSGPNPADWLYGVRVFGSGVNSDFVLDSNGDFVPYNLPSQDSLVFQSVSEFTGHVLTTGDGTQLYYPGNQVTTLDHQTFIRRSMSKVVYPNGFTKNVHTQPNVDGSIYSVRTNTGFQLKYDFTGSWTSSSPSKVTALNNRYERCPDDSTSCTPSTTWPYSTYTWPLGEPDPWDSESLKVDSIFAVRDAGGLVTEYHHSVYESETGDFAPRVVAIKKDGATVMTYDYEWNQTLEYSSDIHSIVYTTGIATVGSASQPGGGAAGYSIGFTKYCYGNPCGAINGGGSGIGANYYVEHTSYGALVKIDSWDQTVNFDYGKFLDPQYGIGRVTNRVASVYQKRGGITVTFQYDDRGNVTERTENGAIVGKAQYPTSCTASNFKYCNKPEWIEDAKGNRTDYSYHPPSGQIASRTLPADQNGVRAKTVYQYDQYYAHYKIDGETIEAASDPIWLLTSETSCQDSAMNPDDTCSGNDEIVTSFEYDYFNLYTRGVAITARNTEGVVETRRTCFEYDKFGNKISETSPRANLATCL